MSSATFQHSADMDKKIGKSKEVTLGHIMQISGLVKKIVPFLPQALQQKYASEYDSVKIDVVYGRGTKKDKYNIESDKGVFNISAFIALEIAVLGEENRNRALDKFRMDNYDNTYANTYANYPVAYAKSPEDLIKYYEYIYEFANELAGPSVSTELMWSSPTLTQQQKRFEICLDYRDMPFKDMIKSAGFRFDGINKCWYTEDDAVARKMAQFADVNLKQKWEQQAQEEFARYELSMAKTSTFDVPTPQGKEMHGFQKAGVEYALTNWEKNNRNTLIADEPGLGKTIQAIGVINHAKFKKILIICPASLKLNWCYELLNWLLPTDKANDYPLTEQELTNLSLKHSVKMTKKNVSHYEAMHKIGWSIHVTNYKSKLAFDSEADINIVNFDQLRKIKDVAKTIPFEIIVVDEAHKVINLGSRTSPVQRTMAFHEIKEGKKLLMLTGTPILNRPEDMYYMLYSLDPEKWGPPFKNEMFWWFMKYFAGYHSEPAGGLRRVWVAGEPEHLDELQALARKGYMIRRLKSDVLPFLPSKIRQVVRIEGNPDASEENVDIKDILDGIQSDTTSQAITKPEDFDKAVTDMKASLDCDIGRIAEARKRTTLKKLPKALEFCDELLESTSKLLLFAHHHEVVDVIMNYFGSMAVKYIGGMNDDEKNQSVKAFMENPAIKVFVGSITAAGVGLTLTAANTVVFIELDWVPANVQQCEDRVHRIGQKDSVNVYYTVIIDSIDEVLAQTIKNKLDVIDKALNITIETAPDLKALTDKQEADRIALKEEAERIQKENLRVFIEEMKTYLNTDKGRLLDPDLLKGVLDFTYEKEKDMILVIKHIDTNVNAIYVYNDFISDMADRFSLSPVMYIYCYVNGQYYDIPQDLKTHIYGPNYTRKNKPQIQQDFTVKQRMAMVKGLDMMHQLDVDQARFPNKVGYNKIDGTMGHSFYDQIQKKLAKRIPPEYTLSAKQWHVTYNILRKYQGQFLSFDPQTYQDIYGP